jgi:hypothetical protein
MIEILLLAKLDDTTFMTAILAFAFFWSSVSASLAFAIWDLHVTHYRTIKSTYDFMENHQDMVIYWKESGVGRWPLLVGENTFKRRFGLVLYLLFVSFHLKLFFSSG